MGVCVGASLRGVCLGKSEADESGVRVRRGTIKKSMQKRHVSGDCRADARL